MPTPKPFDERAATTRKMAIQTIKGKHQLIMRMHLAGKSNLEISERLHISNTRVSTIINSPLFQLALMAFKEKLDAEATKRLTNDVVSEKIGEAQEKAAEKVISLIDGEDVGRALQFKAAVHVLALGGHNVKQELNVTGVNVQVKEIVYDDEGNPVSADIDNKEETVD